MLSLFKMTCQTFAILSDSEDFCSRFRKFRECQSTSTQVLLVLLKLLCTKKRNVSTRYKFVSFFFLSCLGSVVVKGDSKVLPDPNQNYAI
jgi:hypothetical protein